MIFSMLPVSGGHGNHFLRIGKRQFEPVSTKFLRNFAQPPLPQAAGIRIRKMPDFLHQYIPEDATAGCPSDFPIFMNPEASFFRFQFCSSFRSSVPVFPSHGVAALFGSVQKQIQGTRVGKHGWKTRFS